MLFTKENGQFLKELWTQDWTLKGFLASFACLLVALGFGSSIAAYLFFVSGFTSFDILGYLGVSDAGVSKKLIGYRVNQVWVQMGMLLVVWMTGGFWAALGCEIAHWFCVCDKLYYLFQNNQQYEGEYNWLNDWSVFRVLSRLGYKPFTKQLNTVAITGFLLGLFFAIL